MADEWDDFDSNLEEERKKDEEQKQKEIEILKNPNLFNMITEHEFDKTIVGEKSSKKSIFLLNCIIWVEGVRAHTLVGGESSAGKDHTACSILSIFPEEKFIHRTRITPQALTYWHANDKSWSWENKILYLPDIENTVLNSDTFKVMASEGSYVTVVKNQKAVDIKINGIPNIVVTTAESEPKNEVLNRFNLVSLDESEEQTEKIMEFIAKEDEPKYDKDVKSALRRLKTVRVFVPFAKSMIRYLPKDIKMRRMFKSLVSLIKASTALYQYQREKDSEGKYISTKQDYEIAREIIGEIGEQTITGLTTTEEKYFNKFEDLTKKNECKLYSYKEIHEKTCYKSAQMWWEMMCKLEKKGMVTSISSEIEGSKKPVTTYAIASRKIELKLRLPPYEELINQIK